MSAIVESSEQTPLLLNGYTWEQYLSIEEIFRERGTRVRFLQGELEIMAPVSENHERKKSNIGCLIEAWCLEKDIEFISKGNYTMTKPDESGGEPDECYCFHEDKQWPDLVVEVALTSGGLSKRAFYATFPVPEIWIWRQDSLEVHLFNNSKNEYSKADTSEQLPGIDLAWLVDCSNIKLTSEAIKTFRSKL